MVTNAYPLYPLQGDHPTGFVVTDAGQGGVVTDPVTGLEWQQDCSQVGIEGADAGAYCTALGLGGHSDWRIPTRIELATIIDYGAPPTSPAIDSTVFLNTGNNPFWTGSPSLDIAQHGGPAGFYVSFGNGFVGDAAFNQGPQSLYLVRCVRGPTSAPGPHYLVSPDTVTDKFTTLVWQRDVGPAANASDAASYCAGLNLGALGSGWRLPTARELQSLVDETRFKPAIDPTFTNTPNGPNGYLRTSTPGASANTTVQVDFGHGYTDEYNADSTLTAVRCVHDAPP